MVDSIALPSDKDLTVQDLHKDKTENSDRIALIDVRPAEQFNIVNLPGSINIPTAEITKGNRKEEIDEIFANHDKVYVMCRRGNASRTATKYLLENGYSKAINVRGGITEYVNEIDNEMPMY